MNRHLTVFLSTVVLASMVISCDNGTEEADHASSGKNQKQTATEDNGNKGATPEGDRSTSDSQPRRDGSNGSLPERGHVLLTGLKLTSYSGIVDLPWGETNLNVPTPAPVEFSSIYGSGEGKVLYSTERGPVGATDPENGNRTGIYKPAIQQESIRKLIVNRPGDYFVAWTLPVKRLDGESVRSAVRTTVFVNGVRRRVGVGESSYIRLNSGHEESSCHLHVLLTGLSKGDAIRIKIQRTAGTEKLKIHPDGKFALYAERVPSSESVFSATATRSTDGKNLNAKPAALLWTGDRVDDGFSRNPDRSPEQVKIEREGDYLVFVNVPLKAERGQRTSVGGELLLDGERVDGGVFRQGYIRGKDGHQRASIHFAGLVRTTESGQTLSVRVGREADEGEEGAVSTGDRKATLLIRPLPDEGIYAGAATTVTGSQPEDWNPKNARKIRWSTDRRIDDEVYEHDPDETPETVTVREDGDYLVTLNTALTSSNGRVNPELRVLVNGSPVPGATAQTHYIRSNSNHSGSSAAGTFLLPDLTEGDTISVRVKREAGGGTVTAEEKALLTIWRKS